MKNKEERKNTDTTKKRNKKNTDAVKKDDKKNKDIVKEDDKKDIDKVKKDNKKNKDTTKKHSKKFIIIVGIISLLIIIAACITFVVINNEKEKNNKEMSNIRKQNSSAIIDYKETIEYKTKWTYEEFLKNLIDESKLSNKTNIKVMVNDKKLKTSSEVEFDKVGSYKIDIYLNKKYSYKIIKKFTEDIEVNKEIVLNVKDTIFPVIEGVSDKTITVGDKIDLLSGISATDKVEGKIEVKTEGEVDTSKAGTYKIKVYAIDANGNRTDKEFIVTVNKKVTTSNWSSNKSSSSSSGGSSSGGCSSSLLQRRGYNSADPDACSKNNQATVIANQIASSARSSAYGLAQIQAAARGVSNYYYRGVHKESGYDYRTPYGVFIKGESSCAGTTRALIQVLEAMGYSGLQHANANGWTHQWVIFTINGQVGWADGQIGQAGFGTHPYVNQ